MSSDPDVTRIVRSWLEGGADRLPDRVLDSVMELVPSTPQRRPLRLARRLPITMPTLFRGAIAAAAVVVAVVAGTTLLGRNPGVGTGPPYATPSISPLPSGLGAGSPAPADTTLTSDGVGRSLPAGSYGITGTSFAVPFTITFPSEWTLSKLSQEEAAFIRSAGDSRPSVGLSQVDRVYADPCHKALPAATSSVPLKFTELVTALTHMVGFKAARVRAVNIGGHTGKAFVLTNAINTATAKCLQGLMLPLWSSAGIDASTNGGTTEQIWVLDVPGTPVVIVGESDQDGQSELDEVVNGLRFD
jgi:hypothetical protein